jgi:Glycosyltransferase family 87
MTIGDQLRKLQRRYAPFLEQGSAGNKRLVLVLGLIVGVLAIIGLQELLAAFVLGNDVEIPLRAAERWSSGGQPYPASAMLVYQGGDLPFLYPPFLLPLIVPFSHLPHDVVSAVWMALLALAAIWSCRRLGIPWPAVPFVLAWPPFAEGLITGNVQIAHFAAFVALLYVPGAVAPVQKAFAPARDWINGLQAAAVGVLKVTQLLPVLYLARRRFRAAVVSGLLLVALFVVFLPLTGLAVYGDWFAQLQRADGPAFAGAGIPLSRILGVPDLAMAAIGIAIVLLARGRDAAAWLGIAMILSAPSMHGYGMLFLLPGLLTLRRDVAIALAALFLGNYHGYAWWLAVLMVAYLLVASRRWSWLRASAGPAAAEPDPAAAPAARPLASGAAT